MGQLKQLHSVQSCLFTFRHFEVAIYIAILEGFEDTNGVIRIRKTQ